MGVREGAVGLELEVVDCVLATVAHRGAGEDSPEPHSGQRWFLRVVLSESQTVSCESAGKPVQPMWRSGN